jgi:hypothetical protein
VFLLLLTACPWVLADNELTPHIEIRFGGEVES